MTEPANSAGTIQHAQCPVCDAQLRSGDPRCWLCGAVTQTSSDGDRRFSRPGSSTPLTDPSQSFSLASLMMFITLCSVVLGTITIAPGLGVPLGFVSFFTWINTATVVQRFAAKGVKLSSGERALLFIRSFISTVTLLSLLAVAGGAALATAIYTSCALDANWAHTHPYATYAVVAAFVAVSAIFAFVMLVRYKLRRRRREIDEADNNDKEKR